MLPKLYQGLDTATNRYGAALVATWREAKARSNSNVLIPFSKEDIVRHGDELRRLGVTQEKLAVKNIPDIIYTFRAREDLPAEIESHGHYAIIGQGKGLYAFAKIPFANRFTVPVTIKVEKVKNLIPHWARSYMTHDEQGMLASLQNNDLVSKYLTLKSAFRLQSHLRMGVKSYGQVEIDELYVGEKHDGTHVGIAVEAKDFSSNDCLNVAQLFGASRGIKQLFPALDLHLLGVKPDQNGRVCMAEFYVADDPALLKQKKDWLAYELI